MEELHRDVSIKYKNDHDKKKSELEEVYILDLYLCRCIINASIFQAARELELTKRRVLDAALILDDITDETYDEKLSELNLFSDARLSEASSCDDSENIKQQDGILVSLIESTMNIENLNCSFDENLTYLVDEPSDIDE